MNADKTCRKCKVSKCLTEYFRSSRNNDGLQAYCKDCQKTYKNTDTQKVKSRENRRVYEHANPERKLLWSARDRAKERGYDFDLELSDIVIPENCPVYGIPLFNGDGAPSDNSPSIDRFDNSKGYTKDNIRIISWKANNIKSNRDLSDLKELVTWWEKELNSKK